MSLKVVLIIFLTLTSAGAVYYFAKPWGNVLGSSTKASQTTTAWAPDGYSYTWVKTKVGNFSAYVYKANLSKVIVKTVSASPQNCKNNCPAKNLRQYALENNAVAAINGSYFCPPDYTSCKGKINSFDFKDL